MIEFNIDKTNLPKLLRKEGTKKYLEAIKNAQNRALNAAKREANIEARVKYGLPQNGSENLPPSPYEKPSVKSVIQSSLVRSVGGVESGVSSKVLSQKKRLSAIRFLTSARTPIKQKGIPRAKRRQAVGITLGSRTYLSRKKFVQKGNNTSRLHVFRSKETPRKWLMIRNTIASVARLLRRKQVETRMIEKAEKRFKVALDKETQKRLR